MWQHGRVRSAEGGQEGARVVGLSEAAKPFRPESRQQRELGQGLGVEHEGRSLVDASAEDRDQGVTGDRAAPVDLADEGGLLPGDEAACQGQHLDPGSPGSVLHLPGRDLGADGQHQSPGLQRGAQQGEPVDHQARRAGEQDGVLRAEWLALHGVADHDGAVAGDRGELACRGESRAAAAGESGRLDEPDQAGGVEPGERLGRSRAEEPVEASGCFHQERAHRATTLAARARPRSAYDGSRRQPTARVTAPTHTAAIASIHSEPASVPVPRPCSRATGHNA